MKNLYIFSLSLDALKVNSPILSHYQTPTDQFDPNPLPVLAVLRSLTHTLMHMSVTNELLDQVHRRIRPRDAATP
jgi:hypothetical protein